MSIIFETLLPPKVGYVEVIDADGNHVYQPTPEQLEKEQQQKSYEELAKENKLLKAQLKASVDRNEFTEELIAELAMEVYQV